VPVDDDPHMSPALDSADPFGSVTRDLIDSHLAERLLFKVDRMTMAHSLEARVPFLDHQLVEFAFSVPARWKLRGQTRKYLLRWAFRDQLPPQIFGRPKHAFDLPCAAWLRSTLAPCVDDLFARPSLSDLIDARHTATLWDRHRSGRGDHSAQIWALMTLELWARNFGHG
jgi:asparagine synthase (glutamine-hydrolysing)